MHLKAEGPYFTHLGCVRLTRNYFKIDPLDWLRSLLAIINLSVYFMHDLNQIRKIYYDRKNKLVVVSLNLGGKFDIPFCSIFCPLCKVSRLFLMIFFCGTLQTSPIKWLTIPLYKVISNVSMVGFCL